MRGPTGILSVAVVEARNLLGKDTIGKNDPYVEVYVDKHKMHRTSVANNAGSNAIWNEKLTLAVDGETTLHVRVMDKDVVDSDKIGSVTINLHDIAKAGLVEGWYKLRGMLGLTSNGDIYLKLGYTQAA
ncbi:C2 domain-containing protein [Cladochytrium replicatum]|nr:C2 domain-containing protein [Cladochytrium replicatum]